MDEFLKALALIEPVVLQHLEYRLYYDDTGNIIHCSMQQHPDGNNYIAVDKEIYDNYFRYHIKNGKLIPIAIAHNYKVQLIKSDTGYPVVRNHAALLLEPNETYDNIEHYDSRNS